MIDHLQLPVHNTNCDQALELFPASVLDFDRIFGGKMKKRRRTDRIEKEVNRKSDRQLALLELIEVARQGQVGKNVLQKAFNGAAWSSCKDRTLRKSAPWNC